MKTINYLRICIWIAIAGLSTSVSAQYRFNQLTDQQGLSQNWIKTIHQDHLGFMWFGCNDGLKKFDGYEVTVYRHSPSNPSSIHNNNVQCILERNANELWVGTQKGLTRYIRDGDYFQPITSTLGFDIIAIEELNNGHLLIGLPQGLYLLNTTTMEFKGLFYDRHVYDVLQDTEGNIWIATNKGLMLYDIQKPNYRSYLINQLDPSSPQNSIRSIMQDSQDRIWLGNNKMEVYKMELNSEAEPSPTFINYGQRTDKSQNTQEGAVLSILEDNKGQLWIGTDNNGLDIISLKSDQHFSTKHFQYDPGNQEGIPSSSVYCIYQDNQETIWIGTYGGGLSIYNPYLNKFGFLKHQPNQSSLNDNHVNVIYTEKDKVWIGTEGGLNAYDVTTDKFQHLVHHSANPKSIGSNAIYSIYRDHRDNLWVGTWAGGLNLYTPEDQSFHRFVQQTDNPRSISSNNVFSITEDGENNLWIGTMGGGLNKFSYRDSSFTSYKEEAGNSISNDWVRCLHYDQTHNELWISTATAVDVFSLDNEQFRSFRYDSSDAESISFDGAICIYQDSKATIWLGTENGLNAFNRSTHTFIRYTETNGLPDNTVRSIVEDHHGNLWLGTSNGIIKFHHARDLPTNPQFDHFLEGDGLQGDDFNRRAAMADLNGHIYFGGSNGLNVFHPDSIQTNPYPPRVEFTDFQIFNKPVEINQKDSPLTKHINLTDTITLLPHQTVFSIEYAALNYVSSHENQYSFILEGFEENWNHVGTHRSATYTNLDPGTYTFKVHARNNDEVKSVHPTSLVIHILPHWWQTIWSRLTAVVIVLIGLYFFRKYTLISINMKNQLWMEHLQNEKLEELNRMKIEFFTNISHELRTPITLIAGPLKKLIKSGQQSSELLLIQRNAERLKTLVNQILDFQKVDSDTSELSLKPTNLKELIGNIVSDFKGLAKQQKVQLIFLSDLPNALVMVDPQKMEKIMANLISNAIKYSLKQGQVKVLAEAAKGNKEDLIQITVKDNGIGIRPEDQQNIFNRFYSTQSPGKNIYGTGIGLHLTQKLVRQHQGEIVLESAPGYGTTFVVNIPLIIGVPGQTKEHVADRMPMSDFPTFSVAKKRILVIDDNQEMCDYIKGLLDQYFEVAVETNPCLVEDRLGKFSPHLIISDVMMPTIDGFDLCHQLKANDKFAHIPIILLTAKTTDHDHITGLKTGADDYIYKPFDEDLLVTRIQNLLKQREELRHLWVGHHDILNDTNHSQDQQDDLFMNEILGIIKEHYANPDFSANLVIKNMNMSRSSFYKRYKHLSDISVNDRIKNFRLKRAEELLLHTQMTVSEIAYATGFNNQTYFSTLFREHYAMTPSAFRQSLA